MSIKVLKERSVFLASDSPFGIDSALAEIVVEDDGRTVYLCATWVSEAPDEITFETTFESLYDVYLKINTYEGDDDQKWKEHDRILNAGMNEDKAASRYPEQRESLVGMIKERLKEQDIDFDDEEDED